MEHGAVPPDDAAPEPVEVEETGPDRDLAALQALESELASLEGELDRIEGSGRPTTLPDAPSPGDPST